MQMKTDLTLKITVHFFFCQQVWIRPLSTSLRNVFIVKEVHI